jgi:excisionase family DNA binding protein
MRHVTNVDDVKVLKVTEVAHALRVSKMTVYRMIKTGELKTIKVGRSFRIHEKSFADYLAAATEAGKL